MSNRLAQLLATLLGVISFGVALYVTYLVARTWAQPRAEINLPFQAGFVAYIVFTSFLGLIVGARARRADARTLGVYFSLAALTASSSLLGAADHLYLTGPPTSLSVATALSAGFGLAAIVRFSQLFPEPLDALRTKRAWSARRWTRGLSGVLALVNARGVVWLLGGLVAVSLALRLVDFTIAFALSAVLVSGTLVLLNLWTTYRISDTVTRRPIFWIAEGVVIGFVFIVLDVSLLTARALFGIQIGIPDWESWLMMLGLFSAAVFLMVLVFLFAGVENLIVNIVAERLGLTQFGPWIAAGTVALAFGPLRNVLSRRFLPKASGEKTTVVAGPSATTD